jgi:hypothetical protein
MWEISEYRKRNINAYRARLVTPTTKKKKPQIDQFLQSHKPTYTNYNSWLRPDSNTFHQNSWSSTYSATGKLRAVQEQFYSATGKLRAIQEQFYSATGKLRAVQEQFYSATGKLRAVQEQFYSTTGKLWAVQEQFYSATGKLRAVQEQFYSATGKLRAVQEQFYSATGKLRAVQEQFYSATGKLRAVQEQFYSTYHQRLEFITTRNCTRQNCRRVQLPSTTSHSLDTADLLFLIVNMIHGSFNRHHLMMSLACDEFSSKEIE